MPLSEATKERCQIALDALRALREEYADVLVVLDYVSLSDIAKYQSDGDDPIAGEVLTEEEMGAVLWHVGKHIGNASQDVLAALVDFALNDHVRRNIAQRGDKKSE